MNYRYTGDTILQKGITDIYQGINIFFGNCYFIKQYSQIYVLASMAKMALVILSVH